VIDWKLIDKWNTNIFSNKDAISIVWSGLSWGGEKIDIKTADLLSPIFFDKILKNLNDNELFWFLWWDFKWNFNAWDLYYLLSQLEKRYPDHPEKDKIKQTKEKIYKHKTQILRYQNIYDVMSHLQPSLELKKRREDLENQEIYIKEFAEKDKFEEWKNRLLQDQEYQKLRKLYISTFHDRKDVEINFYITKIIEHFGWKLEKSSEEIFWNPYLKNTEILALLPEDLYYDEEFIDLFLLINNFTKFRSYEADVDTYWLSQKYPPKIIEENFNFIKTHETIHKVIKDHHILFDLFISENMKEKINKIMEKRDARIAQFRNQTEEAFFDELSFSNPEKDALLDDIELNAILHVFSGNNQPISQYHWISLQQEWFYSPVANIDLHDNIPAIQARFNDTEKVDYFYRFGQKNTTLDIKKIMIRYGLKFNTAFLIYKLEFLNKYPSAFFSPSPRQEVSDFTQQQWFQNTYTRDELVSLRQYQTGSVSYLNGFLRTGKTKNPNITNILLENISSAIEKNKLKEETILYRQIYREWINQRKDKKIWDKFYEKGFPSTSFTDRFQKIMKKDYGGILLKITAPAGTPYVHMDWLFSWGWTYITGLGSKYYNYANQDEILLQKNTNFEITNIIKNEDWTDVYEVKIIP
jgi:hypothetical protein